MQEQMQDKMMLIVKAAEDAQHILITGSPLNRSAGEPQGLQKKLTYDFLRAAKNQASERELQPSIENQLDEMAASYVKLPQKEPAFRCVENYKSCKASATTIEDRVLCGIALAICFTKEVVPLA